MKYWLMTLAGCTALFPVQVLAESPAADPPAATDPAESGNEIIVTAQHYAQRLQDVPLSVSVLGADALRNHAASTVKDLQYSVPGLSLIEYGPGQQYIQIRGISNSIGSPTVGQYLDETPLGLLSNSSVTVRMLDMERVEVLRGPQATLYGEGSMGGTIRYIPAAPRLNAVSGSIEGQFSTARDGNDGGKVNGVINLPIVTDKLGVRLVAGYEHTPGWIDSVPRGLANINSGNVYTVRGILLARPTERLGISLLGLHQTSDQANQTFGLDRKTYALVPQPISERYDLVQGKLAYDADFARLEGSASYIDRTSHLGNDITGPYAPYLGLFGIPAGFITTIAQSAGYTDKVFNGELRLSSQGHGPLRWMIGAVYRDLKDRQLAGVTTTPGQLPFTLLAVDSRLHTRSVAVYGELGYEITPRLKVVAGLRYARESRSQDSTSTSFGTTAIDVNHGAFPTLNPRFNLSYAFTPDSMVYVNVAKGFRAGGFNLSSAGQGIYTIPLTYKPDRMWTYEAGTKHQLFGNRLVLDASVYRTVWSGVQSYDFAPGSPVTIVTNSGHVTGWGVDFSAIARPTPTLTVTATVGWNDLAFDRATGDKAVGDPPDFTIPESHSIAIDYRPKLSARVTGIFHFDYQHSARGQVTLRNFGNQIIDRPAHDLVGLRAGVAIANLEIAAFVTNLTDDRRADVIGPFGSLQENLEQPPRVIGINGRISF